jgi:hypothetical protein
MAGSLSVASISVSSAKVAMVDSGEVGRSAVYQQIQNSTQQNSCHQLMCGHHHSSRHQKKGLTQKHFNMDQQVSHAEDIAKQILYATHLMPCYFFIPMPIPKFSIMQI